MGKVQHNTRNYCVFGLCPSSSILKTREQNVLETDSVSKTMDNVQKPSNSESYTPLSEPFRATCKIIVLHTVTPS
jgi:hypothetical protein